MVQVIIVGAGRGGSRLIDAFSHHPVIRVTCVVDIRRGAPGMELASAHGIMTSTNYEEVVRGPIGRTADVILEVTGDQHIYEHLVRLARADTVVISGLALRFFMLLIEEQLELIRQMQKGQRELNLVLNATHDGMIGINRDGVITLFNAAAERLLPTKACDAIGRDIDDVIENSNLRSVVTSRTPSLNQVQKVHGIEIVSNQVPVFDEDGMVVGAIAVFRDVTELRHLASEVTNLREIQTLLEAVIQSTQDAISVVDKDGKGLLINPAYTRLTGLPPEQVIGKPADVDIAEGDSMHMLVLRTGQPVRNVPMKVGPARKEVIVNVAPILVGGELRGSVGVIHDISEIKRLTEELAKANQLIRSLNAKYTFEDIVGKSAAMVVAIQQAKRAAQTPATVLLRGESGTGKELFAHAIHNESERRYRPFVRVNCAALSESLLESELFGYDEGAFTGAKRGGKRGLFEEADGGTLFLDEIGEMTVSTQAKLLRALQEQEIVRVGGTKPIPVRVRVIGATHVNLEQAVAHGRFREDLYYRLNVIPIVIPPLRYRREDIPSIAEHILFRHNQSYGRNVEKLTRDAVQILEKYDWPGNVRELENAVGRAMIHMAYHETELDAHHLPTLWPRRQAHIDETSTTQPDGVDGMEPNVIEPLEKTIRVAEENAIRRALKATQGNKTEAARRLGISVRSLYYKMEHFEQGSF